MVDSIISGQTLSSESEIDAAFASLAELRADGLVVEGNPFFEAIASS
jgi:hypothetical protein